MFGWWWTWACYICLKRQVLCLLLHWKPSHSPLLTVVFCLYMSSSLSGIDIFWIKGTKLIYQNVQTLYSNTWNNMPWPKKHRLMLEVYKESYWCVFEVYGSWGSHKYSKAGVQSNLLHLYCPQKWRGTTLILLNFDHTRYLNVKFTFSNLFILSIFTSN